MSGSRPLHEKSNNELLPKKKEAAQSRTQTH